MDQVRSKVYQIVADLFLLDIASVHDKLAPEDVSNWDSMQHLNLLLALEADFGIQITPEESTQMLNVGLVVLLVEEKLSKCL